jgi:hypothetical protein
MIVKLNYPVKIELELPDGYGGWEVCTNSICTHRTEMESRISKWKNLYALNNKTYRIYVVTPSKANKKMIREINDDLKP